MFVEIFIITTSKLLYTFAQLKHLEIMTPMVWKGKQNLSNLTI